MPMTMGVEQDNQLARQAWNANARFWNERMGEGNDFFELLLWPATLRLLDPKAGQRLLDVGCGNGLTCRRLADKGARVVAFDFSEQMIECARTRSAGYAIDYKVLDATSEGAFAQFDDRSFDGACANMVLMDMADIRVLMKSVARLLKPGGRFVFSVTHPCFNNPTAVLVGELEDREGLFTSTYSVKISRYATPHTRLGLAMAGQPEPHPYFHRSMGRLLGEAFLAGLVVDGLEEPTFAPEVSGRNELSWSGRFNEIPPALVVRTRLGSDAHP